MTNNKTVGDVLRKKGDGIYSVAPNASVYEALMQMASRDVGALLVISDGRLCGVFSERDYARKVILAGKASRDTTVAEIMSPIPITVEPQQTIDDCLNIMTKCRVRHLPVVRGDEIAGMVSIGDLVNWTIESQSEAIEQLNQYITGAYPS